MKYKILLTLYKLCTCPRTSKLKFQLVPVFLQDQNFWGSLMTPCLKIWGSLANLEGQNFLLYNYFLYEHASILKVFEECPLS